MVDELRRARDLGLEESELAPLLDGLTVGLVEALFAALLLYSEALAEVGT